VKGGLRWVVLILTAVLCLSLGSRAWAQEWEEAFFKANQAYREGDFNGAIQGYLRLIRTGHRGGQIHYNLRNAYFRAGRLGRAILEYERAHLLIPRDPDLNFNLAHARDQTRDAVEQSRGFVESAFFWVRSFSLNELFWAFAVLNILLWSVLAIRLFARPEWLYYMLLLVLSSWFVVGTSLGLKYYWITNDDRAVILHEQVDVLAGPEENDTVLFRLHEGTVVHRDREEDGWCLIHLPDGKRGWTRSEAMELISGDGPLPPYGSSMLNRHLQFPAGYGPGVEKPFSPVDIESGFC